MTFTFDSLLVLRAEYCVLRLIKPVILLSMAKPTAKAGIQVRHTQYERRSTIYTIHCAHLVCSLVAIHRRKLPETLSSSFILSCILAGEWLYCGAENYNF